MKVLFITGHCGFLRNFESALRHLVERGHSVHVSADGDERVGGIRIMERLTAEFPSITFGWTPKYIDSPWYALARLLRVWLDYLRYLEPEFADAPKLRLRAEKRAGGLAVLLRLPFLRSRWGRRLVRGVLVRLERAIPPGPNIVQFLRDQHPDVVVITPLLYFGSPQVDVVRAARQLGIPSMLAVTSWDHLTTKGLIHEVPDRVLVWNAAQAHEAARLHGVPMERIVVTGAQAYDHWFTWQPSRTREAFCREAGLDPAYPILLYLCSSPFVAPNEAPFVREWIRAVRSLERTDLRGAGIIVRPHPQNAEQWAQADLSEFGNAVIWPRNGANPVDEETRADYFDSMYHALSVVGVNTSGLIEAGIVGRPVHTILADEFEDTQEGTLHFHHLRNVNGGLLHIARDMQEHLSQLSLLVQDGATAYTARNRSFIEAFVRPHGWGEPATPLFVSAVERTGVEVSARPVPETASDRMLRRLLQPAAALVRAGHDAEARRRAAALWPRTPQARARDLRILFVMASPEYLRYFDSTLRLLAERGHAVLLAVNAPTRKKKVRLDRSALRHERIKVVGVVPRRQDVWYQVARRLRGTIDYIHFLDPRFIETPALRARMQRKVLPRPLRVLDRIQSIPGPVLRAIIRGLVQLERAIPSSLEIEAFLRELRPDLVLVSPLVDAASDQVDLIKSARALGLPTGACIASWDNLTNKGLMRLQPDAVFVWNEIQRQEAIAFHETPPERIVVTGAQPFDRWFNRMPALSRREFCAAIGLPEERPLILYVGSSGFVAPAEREVAFVRAWLQAIRSSDDARLREASVLVRPHPYNTGSWATADLSAGPVAIWPRQPVNPVDEQEREMYFDSLFYSAAVVGINTSAMVEAAVVGRPVLTVLTPEFSSTQEGTLHFHYLRKENGGCVETARTLQDHLRQLGEALAGDRSLETDRIRFVQSFIRPQGVDIDATSLLATAVEQLGRMSARREPVPPVLLPVQMSLWALGTAIRMVARGRRRPGRLAALARPKPGSSERIPRSGHGERRAGRVLFLTGHFAFLRNFESVIRLLAERGHRIHLAADHRDAMGGVQLVQAMAADHPLISYGWTPDRTNDPWLDLATAIRFSLDYLRFLEPEFASAPFLVARMARRTPSLTIWLSRAPLIGTPKGRRILRAVLLMLERALPRQNQIEKFLRGQAPDVVLITPLLGLGSEQYDYLRSAKALGLRTVLCVTSWDHLSSKALIRDLPDLVTVWNNTQRDEALRMHAVPSDRIAVTGAQCYDHWFEWTPSGPRTEFCARVGLDPEKPYILYVCSAIFKGTGSEAEFVQRWIAGIRAHPNPTLRRAGVLVRPHPARLDDWRGVDLSRFSNATLWPQAGANPIDAASRTAYFDSMYHCAAIVGLNTSALIEAAIIDRPVYTILAAELADSQTGTLHFQYLLEPHGGPLRSAGTIEEHLDQLADAVEGRAVDSARNRRFVETFVRPHGLDVSATPRFVEAVQDVIVHGHAVPRRTRWSLYPARGLLYVIFGAIRLGTGLGLIKPIKRKKSKRGGGTGSDSASSPRDRSSTAPALPAGEG